MKGQPTTLKVQSATLTVDQAAKKLGIGRQLAYSRAKTGEIPTLRLGRRLLVSRVALEALLAKPPRPAEK